jgi:mono/diheme cytochrome c family protein
MSRLQSITALVTCLFISIIISVSCGSKPPPGVSDPGHLLYLGFGNKDVNCAKCHGQEGQGGWKGPDIRDVFVKSDSSKIVQIIKEGKKGEKEMPGFEDKLSEHELLLILQHLKTMTPDSP